MVVVALEVGSPVLGDVELLAAAEVEEEDDDEAEDEEDDDDAEKSGGVSAKHPPSAVRAAARAWVGERSMSMFTLLKGGARDNGAT